MYTFDLAANFMKFLKIVYSIILLLLSLYMAIVLLLSSHKVDVDFLIVLCTSFVIFPGTVYLINKSNKLKKVNIFWATLFLALTGTILIITLMIFLKTFII